ncbi:hypothetical protein NDU88_005526 [Pleurodeles waltl]|uniref:Uncharacterized protein n=1 Tax=Pleurodeles waltl TaxID=8319 RepID=A0AAV7ULB0_PLEWA|nr:hypothetical protein NDU88_005526 [Pleurodeles waltl]
MRVKLDKHDGRLDQIERLISEAENNCANLLARYPDVVTQRRGQRVLCLSVDGSRELYQQTYKSRYDPKNAVKKEQLALIDTVLVKKTGFVQNDLSKFMGHVLISEGKMRHGLCIVMSAATAVEES